METMSFTFAAGVAYSDKHRMRGQGIVGFWVPILAGSGTKLSLWHAPDADAIPGDSSFGECQTEDGALLEVQLHANRTSNRLYVELPPQKGHSFSGWVWLKIDSAEAAELVVQADPKTYL